MADKEKEIDEYGIVYREEFNSTAIRAGLGLDGHSPRLGMSKSEMLRLANLLFRTGNLSGEDIRCLGMVVRQSR